MSASAGAVTRIEIDAATWDGPGRRDGPGRMHFERYAMTLTLPSLVVCLLLALPASAQNASPAKPLPERKDVVSWSTFAQVQLSRAGDRFEPQFSAAVAALDQKSVKVQGFMLPLDTGA